MTNFKSTKREFKKAFEDVLKTNNSYEIDEAAFPAYAHKNFLIDFLFWQRIKIACNYVKNKNVDNTILDFGCGSGVLSYHLAKNGYDVSAIDLELGPLNLIRERINFPKNIDFIEGELISKNFPKATFDIIFAMDVLEHVENLEEYTQHFHKLLKPNGVIIVSGPTENFLYKIGRKIAGSRFTGDYHVTNISKIKNTFSGTFKVTTIKKLLFPFVLFEVFKAEKSPL